MFSTDGTSGGAIKNSKVAACHLTLVLPEPKPSWALRAALQFVLMEKLPLPYALFLNNDRISGPFLDQS
jgi:hypothetical protein